MEYMEKDDQFVICYGIRDGDAKMAYVHRSEIEKILFPVESFNEFSLCKF